MKDSRRDWAIAIFVWLFSAIWITMFVGAMFAGACGQPNLSADQRVFRCGWSLTLSEPLRLIGEPANQYADLYMKLGIAYADLGQTDAAADAFRQAMADAALTPPFLPEMGSVRYSSTANSLIDKALSLPLDSAARNIFFAVAEGAHL